MIESHLNISRTGVCRLTLILAFLLSSLSCSSGLPETASRGRDDAQPANAGEAGEGPAENEPASNRVQLSEEAYRSAGIQVAAVERRTIQLTLRVTGALALDETRSSRIDTPVGGRIVRISVLPGDAVQPGRVLAEVESAELTESVVSLRSAAAEAALRSQETERSRTLFDAKGLSRAELLRRESAEAQARSALTGARQRLGIMGLDAREIDSLIHIGEPSGAGDYDDAVPLAKIRSPRAGRVIASNGMPGQRVSPDQHVAPGEELFLVADTSRLWLILQVHEKDLPGLIAGESVEVHASAYPDIPFHGSIAAISSIRTPARWPRALRSTIPAAVSKRECMSRRWC